MSSNCPGTPAKRSHDASINVTEIVQQRLETASGEDWERLRLCWGYLDCGDCHRSKGHCGWCAISSTCLPLPTDTLSKTFPLLSPLHHDSICALRSERFELRTAGLGCQVSTITFLTSLVTIFCTLFIVSFLYWLSKCMQLVLLGARARKGGYVVHEDGSGGVWVRRSEGWGRWWRRTRGEPREFEVEEIDDGTGRRGWVWWDNRVGERRPLLR